MVKPILQTYPVIYAESEEERAKLRPIGRNKDRYQETVQGWHEVIKAADNQNFWGVATIEHHFWSEGYETTMKILNKKHDLINVNINDSSEKKLHELGFIKIEDAESKKSYWIDLNKENIKTISNNVKKRFNAFNDFCEKVKLI